jgi:aspartate carbamoyltransferase catalytic subunit
LREEEKAAMTTRHLLSATDLTRDEATAILDDADRFRQALVGREVKKLPTLRGRTIITMFYENSTRTRVSFEVAGKWMSADVINVSASGSSAAKGESLRDTALTLRAAGADALIIRHPASGAAEQLAQWTAEDAGDGVVGGGKRAGADGDAGGRGVRQEVDDKRAQGFEGHFDAADVQYAGGNDAQLVAGEDQHVH